MKVLGFDPSLTGFGWCIVDDTQPNFYVASGKWVTGPEDLYVTRYVWLREQVSALVKLHKPDYVVSESPVFGEQYSEGLYALSIYVAEAVFKSKKDFLLLSPGQTKAIAREFLKRPPGWKMTKPDMVEASKLKTGVRKWDHNESDAFWAAFTGLRFWGLKEGRVTASDLTPVETEMFTVFQTYLRGKKAGLVKKKGLLYKEDARYFLWSQEKKRGPKKPKA